MYTFICSSRNYKFNILDQTFDRWPIGDGFKSRNLLLSPGFAHLRAGDCIVRA